MTLLDHPTGGYRTLPGIAPYSCGVVSLPGYEIVRVVLQKPIPYRAGLEYLEDFLSRHNRPRSALCSVALRSPRPMTFAGFAEFNSEYTALLRKWGIYIGDVNPIARTNVAPICAPVVEPLLYEFGFTRPVDSPCSPTFVVAGAGELPEGILLADQIVARGDCSPAGLAMKARFVMDLMETRLSGLGVDWSSVSTVDIYTAHSLDRLLPEIVLPRIGAVSIHGVAWHYSRPPVEEIEYEMDLRGVRTEWRI